MKSLLAPVLGRVDPNRQDTGAAAPVGGAPGIVGAVGAPEPGTPHPIGLASRLPAVTGGRRLRLMSRLVGYGMAHAFAVFLLAHFLRRSLGSGPESPWIGLGVLGILGLTLALFGLRVLEARDAERLGQEYVIRVRQRVLASLLARPWNPAQAPRWGVTMNRLVTDLNSLRNWVSLGLARMLSASVALAGLLIVLLRLHPAIALGMLVLVALAVAVGATLTPALRRLIRETRRQRGRLANQVGELVQTSVAARHLGHAKAGLHSIFRRGRRLRRSVVQRATLAAVLRRVPELVHGVAIAGLLVLASPAVRSEHANFGGVAALLFVLGMIVSALGDLARAWDYRLGFEEGNRRLRSLLREEILAPGPDPQPLPGEGPVGVRFDRVEWKPGGEPWSRRVAPGERVLLTGPTSSGKSMLLRLAARLADPVGGRILLDGVPLPQIEDLPRVVQLVSPEIPLRRGTIRQNLASTPNPICDPALEAIASVLGIAGDDAVVPGGLDTRIADDGADLSAGARARVRLARALLMNPRLLLIDDPALVMDEQSAHCLRRAMEFTRATVMIVGIVPRIPLEPDSIWHLRASGIRVEVRPQPLASPDFERACGGG